MFDYALFHSFMALLIGAIIFAVVSGLSVIGAAVTAAVAIGILAIFSIVTYSDIES